MCTQDALYAALGASGGPGGKVGPGTIVGITLAAALIAAAVGLAVHKLRMRHVMQSEIRSIMSQYMPLVRPRGLAEVPAACPALSAFREAALSVWACCVRQLRITATWSAHAMCATCEGRVSGISRAVGQWLPEHSCGCRACQEGNNLAMRCCSTVMNRASAGAYDTGCLHSRGWRACQEGNNLDDALLPGSSPRIKSSAALAKPPSAPPPAEQC